MKKLQLIAAIMAFFLYGCSEQHNPVEPAQTSGAVSASPLAKGGLITASQRIIASVGGSVRLQGTFRGSDRLDVYYDLSIMFGPNALPRDTTISITIDKRTFEETAEIAFAPCGLVFNRPAVLLMYANNVDIALEYGALQLTYYNANTWQPMPNSWGAYLTNNNGSVIAGAQIPHFSRYAFGRRA